MHLHISQSFNDVRENRMRHKEKIHIKHMHVSVTKDDNGNANDNNKNDVRPKKNSSQFALVQADAFLKTGNFNSHLE